MGVEDLFQAEGEREATKLSEFDIIEKYFIKKNKRLDKSSVDAGGIVRGGVAIGIGDDAAEVRLNSKRLVVATDTLNVGVHFPNHASAEDIASRVVAVNVSDFAAMAARPRWATLSLTLPQADSDWLDKFSESLLQAFDKYGMQLVGGDTTKGPLAISLTVMGEPFAEKLLTRSAAVVGDDIWLSGYAGLGAGSLAVALDEDGDKLSPKERLLLLDQFYRPEPRLALAESLAEFAHTAIDVSDGLLADASHIAKQSHCEMQIYQTKLPVHPLLSKLYSEEECLAMIGSGGDDYELLFTTDPDYRQRLAKLSDELNLKLTRIGTVAPCGPREIDPTLASQEFGDKTPQVVLLDDKNQKIQYERKGFKHF